MFTSGVSCRVRPKAQRSPCSPVQRFDASTHRPEAAFTLLELFNRRWDNRPFALGDQRPDSQPSKAAPTFAVSPAAVV
jgi:hypothetical protein